MSRTGKKSIKLDSAVKVKLDGESFICQGPKGNLSVNIPKGILVKIEDGFVFVTLAEPPKGIAKSLLRSNFRQNNASWGTVRQLIANSVIGVVSGFEKSLVLEGVGFRASVSGQNMTLSVGYSYLVKYTLPEAVKVKLDGNTKIILSSCDKQLLGQIAEEIRAIRKPEPYKGKGIRYEGEIIKRKAGKTGKK
ncbi:MAG: 50S ribosomal protein L6 [SAR324 cluster bacterium]|nr:50S ribosomal protein L6 [SAR324 cluster bacterium]